MSDLRKARGFWAALVDLLKQVHATNYQGWRDFAMKMGGLILTLGSIGIIAVILIYFGRMGLLF